jgi:hypothetical protein
MFMKMFLSVHRNFPKQNMMYLIKDGIGVVDERRAPGVSTIRDARAKFFPRSNPRMVAVIKTHYDGDKKWLERTYSGVVASYAEAVAHKRYIANRLAPGGSVSLRVHLVD